MLNLSGKHQGHRTSHIGSRGLNLINIWNPTSILHVALLDLISTAAHMLDEILQARYGPTLLA